jgi:hypothetical protein
LSLLVFLVVGVVTVTEFGASIDEDVNAHMGRIFLDAYRQGRFLQPPGIEYFNGPFYFMVFTLTAELFQRLNPHWLLTDGLHLTNYITFLVGVFFFYRIALRLLPRGAALFVTALFTTQPVLFGNAFILQKDTPFMAFFLASVEVGWTAADSWKSTASKRVEERGRAIVSTTAAEEWKMRSKAERILVLAGGGLGLLLILDLWWAGGIQSAGRAVLSGLYRGQGPTILVELFSRIAEDAYKTPLPAYLARLDGLFAWWRILASLVIAGAGLAVWRVAMPASSSAILGRWLRRWGLVAVAGCVLGLTTSVRIVAPFAGLLVAGYWLGRSRRQAVPALIAYGAVALVTTYLTWPVLWGNPVEAVMNRTAELFGEGRSDFADHLVLFRSEWHASGDLPWDYLPTLFTLQWTLPAVLLFLVGAPLSWMMTSQDGDRRLVVSLVWLWFLAPVAASMMSVVPNYDSFRHVLFCVPAAFLIMGFAVWKISRLVTRPALRAGMAAAALAPGVLGILRLHPYEYIYFNELAGSVSGAEGNFDLDYGCTAFREAMQVVNRVAELEDLIAFQPWVSTAAPFARGDLQLIEGDSMTVEPDFGLACRRIVRQAFPEMETIYEVRADGALLAVVRQRRDGR